MAAPDELLNPIPGDNPGGEDLRYEAVYDELKEARRADDDIPQGEWQTDRKVADYGQVIKLATDILTKKSKDLQVAAWLTEAWLRKQGFPGLVDGLALLHGIMDKFWDHCYPEIEDDDLEFRAAPLEWVGLRLDMPVKSVPITAKGYGLIEYQEAKALGSEEDADDDEKKEARKEAIADGKLALEVFDEGFEATPKAWYKALVADLDRSKKAVNALDEIGRDKFGPDAPGYRGLLEALEDVARVAKQFLAKKLELDPDPVEEMSEEDEGAAGAGADASGAVPIEPASASDAATRVAAAARFLQRADPTSPAPYLMLRGFRWGELRSNGGELDPKQLAAPPTQVRTKLKGFLLDSKWAELLAAAEGVMASAHGRGWLDLQRYVLTACSNLGSEYDNVANGIRGALASLLHDIPDLVNATLMDDTPTANSETRTWLRNELSGVDAAPTVEVPADQGEGPVVPADGKRTRDAYDRAMMEVRAGRPEKGVELLMREVAQEKSERAKFLRRAQVAGIMVDAGMEEVALPILRDLLQHVETHQLETWEAGETVARPLSLLQRCLVKAEGESEQARDLYLRVCRLDPMQAMAWPKSAEAAASQPASSSDGSSEG